MKTKEEILDEICSVIQNADNESQKLNDFTLGQLTDYCYELLKGNKIEDYQLKHLGSIDLVNEAWYLVKGETLSPSGYIIAQAVRRMKCTKDGNKHYMVVLESDERRVNNIRVDGLIRLDC